MNVLIEINEKTSAKLRMFCAGSTIITNGRPLSRKAAMELILDRITLSEISRLLNNFTDSSENQKKIRQIKEIIKKPNEN